MAKADVRQLVHTPAEMMASYVAWAEQAQAGAGLTFGVPSIDKEMIPMKPGEMIGFMGRPGDGKTTMLGHMANHGKRCIQKRNVTGEVIPYVTWEQSCEELVAFFMADRNCSVSDVAWGRVDLDIVRQKAVKGGSSPIWVIGYGIGRAGKGAPRMTPDVVLGAIESMYADFGVRPVLMLFDYLQLIPVERAGERIQQVTEATIRIKELAQRIGAPAIVAVQASRDVDLRAVKLAESYDAQWSSAIEQTCDKLFSFWRPARTEELKGKKIEMEDGRQLDVTDNLLLVRMLKQRFAKGRFTWALSLDPAQVKLTEMEMRRVEAY